MVRPEKFIVVSIILVTMMILANPEPSEACGPSFPNQLLVGGDEAVLWAPQAEFAVEIRRVILLTDTDPDFRYVPVPDQMPYYSEDEYTQTSEADLIELRLALLEQDTSDFVMQGILGEYETLRETLKQCVNARDQRLYNNFSSVDTEEEFKAWVEGAPTNGWRSYPDLDELNVPDGLPAEFDLYISGAILYYKGEWSEARYNWERILDLPEEDRKFRSTWAAYMIGRSMLYDYPSEAIGWFQAVRELARNGFHDRTGLAASSYNMEARAEECLGNYTTAFERYLDSYGTGDERALIPISHLVYKILDSDTGDDAVLEAASNPLVRNILTVVLGQSFGRSRYRGDPDVMGPWLDALDTVGASDVETADLLAWNAYRAGLIDLAEQWLEKSPETGMSLWLQGKFAIRHGNLEAAGDYLERARNEFPEDEVWWGIGSHVFPWPIDNTTTIPSGRIRAELGAVQLSQGNILQALHNLIWGGYWVDAAYIAENLLTADELKDYVDEFWEISGCTPEGWTYNPATVMAERQCVLRWRIRYLLGRRLTRLGRWDDAYWYYPYEYRQMFWSFVRTVRNANDINLSQGVRAELFWDAAETAREDGMELMGTEVSPDWQVCHGNYEEYDIADVRTESEAVTFSWRTQPVFENLSVSDFELERIELNSGEAQPDLRFHYRYYACDLAWSAIELMPDESEVTAYRLCVAGSWIENESPDLADRFYKAIVNRCGTTSLGQIADELRWFPDCIEDSLM